MEHLALINNPHPELRAFFARGTWKFAKTMASMPHEYLVRPSDKDSPAFTEWETMIAEMRLHSTPRKMGKATYLYFVQDGYMHWTMGAPIPATIILNRARIFDAWDTVAETYDAAFDDAESRSEEVEIRDMVLSWAAAGSILDIGSGTGLLNRLMSIPAVAYEGIDPSPQMCAIARRSFPDHKVTCVSLEAAFVGQARKFDHGVSLFGSMNYVMPRFLPKPRELCRRLFLMFFSPGYQPLTYERTGITLNHFEHSADTLAAVYGVAPWKWKNFLIVQTP